MSIEEMALKAYPKTSRVSEPHGVIPADNTSRLMGDANEEKREGYILGANAVLEEIEKILPNDDKNLNDYGKSLLWRINYLIYELKGKE